MHNNLQKAHIKPVGYATSFPIDQIMDVIVSCRDNWRKAMKDERLLGGLLGDARRDGGVGR